MSEDEFILLWLALRHGSVISVPARGHIHTLLREMGPRKVFWPLSYWAISSIRSKVAGSFIYYLAPGLTGGFFYNLITKFIVNFRAVWCMAPIATGANAGNELPRQRTPVPQRVICGIFEKDKL